MTGEGHDRSEVGADEELETLVAERLEWYAAPGVVDAVPDPRLAHGDDSVRDTTPHTIGCLVLIVGVVYFGNLVDAALAGGHESLVGLARACLVGCTLGIPLLLVRMRRRAARVVLRPELWRPWLDVRDGLRLGEVEPGNPGWGVALAHADRTQRLVRREARRDIRRQPPARVTSELQQAGARTWASSERWRRQQAERSAGAVTPLDRLPEALGPSFAQASAASDAASDAATEALGHGDYDLDFAALAARRAAMYARRTGATEEERDPRQVLLVDTGWGRRTRVLAKVSLVVFLASAAVAGLLVHLERAWPSLLAALPAVASVVVALRLPLAAASPDRIRMSPDVAMPWRDYLEAVVHADSGRAAVPTVEAIRGAEQRVRALVVELVAPTLSSTERPVLLAELHRVCGGAWALVGQERAEERLLDELDDQPFPGGC